MNKVFVLAGMTLSGKTTVAKILSEKYGLDRVIGFTTRPKREGEEDGVEYDFYPTQTLYSLIVSGKVVALRSYKPNVNIGEPFWYYGFLRRKIEKQENPFVTTDFKGFRDFQYEYGKENVFCIYLDVSKDEQMKRMKNREESIQDEQIRRIEADQKDYLGFKDNADLIIKVDKDKPEKIAEKIFKAIEKNS